MTRTILSLDGTRIVAVEGDRVVRGRALTPVEARLKSKLEEEIWNSSMRRDGNAGTLRQALAAWIERLYV